MSVKFTYYGGMCVLIERSDGYKILCDPYIDNELNMKKELSFFDDVNLILVTHAAFDHYGNLEEIMSRSSAMLMAGGDVRRMLLKARVINPNRLFKMVYGDERAFGETIVRPVYAMHVSASSPQGVSITSPPYGFIVQVESHVCYYHTGDTFLYSDMKVLRDLYKPNVMVVGISRMGKQYPCEMNTREAAMAVFWIAPDVVIPSHYAPGSPALAEFKGHLKSFAPLAVVKDGVNATFEYQSYQCVDIN